MANHRVSGQLVPDAVSGHVALEIANTRAGWGTDRPREYLVSYDALAVWAGDVGLVSPGEVRLLRRQAAERPALATRQVRAAIELREAWYAVATAGGAGRHPDEADLAVLAAAVERATRVSRLEPLVDGRVVLDGGDPDRAGPALPVHRAALAAYDLMASGGAAHVGRCGGAGCGWLFHDPTHRRHWCIMAICGNRAKARAYAQRRREQAASPSTA
ncbi:MAG: hypothetical protein GC157_11880 [Frankiales bacterium]|nr:hypothetical protein [Frankiales bacterium]